jgi:vesicle coat complex subunit
VTRILTGFYFGLVVAVVGGWRSEARRRSNTSLGQKEGSLSSQANWERKKSENSLKVELKLNDYLHRYGQTNRPNTPHTTTNQSGIPVFSKCSIAAKAYHMPFSCSNYHTCV